jgi:Cu/Ag efflux protein CusF
MRSFGHGFVFQPIFSNETIMNLIKQCLVASALCITTAATLPASAADMDHGKMEMSQPPAMTDGEVRKVDQAAGKVTIKHGDIKHLDMPGMTMVFPVKDKALLTNVKAGDKIKFMVISEGGKMIVTDIQPAQ